MAQLLLFFILFFSFADTNTNELGIQRYERVAYPPIAYTARVEGTVVADARLNRDGHIKEVQILSGHPMLQRSVKDHLNALWFYCRTCNSTQDKHYRAVYVFQIDAQCDESQGCFEDSTTFRDGHWTIKHSLVAVETESSSGNKTTSARAAVTIILSHRPQRRPAD